MKKNILVLISILTLSIGLFAQSTSKVTQPNIKLSKHDQEVIQSDGYAFAEANCRYEFSKMKLAKNANDKFLLIEKTDNQLLLKQILIDANEKYLNPKLNDIYKKAFDEGTLKLNVCIRMNKMKQQNELEKMPKK